jgi:hypothetical protein
MRLRFRIEIIAQQDPSVGRNKTERTTIIGRAISGDTISANDALKIIDFEQFFEHVTGHRLHIHTEEE